MSEDKDSIIDGMSLEGEPEKEKKLDMNLEGEPGQKKGKEGLDMSLDDSTSSLEARVGKIFEKTGQHYIYITPTDPLCKREDGSYSLRSIPIADLTADWKKKLDEFLKTEGV